MPKVKCSIPACAFETDDLDPAIVASLVMTHAKVYDNTMTPAKVEKVKRPSMSFAGREGQCRLMYGGTGKVRLE